MLIKTKTNDLKIGMYVDLGQLWLKHSFLKPHFLITSDSQIKRIVTDGIKEVRIDPDRSDMVAGESGAEATDRLQRRTTEAAHTPHRQKSTTTSPTDESAADTTPAPAATDPEGAGRDTVDTGSDADLLESMINIVGQPQETLGDACVEGIQVAAQDWLIDSGIVSMDILQDTPDSGPAGSDIVGPAEDNLFDSALDTILIEQSDAGPAGPNVVGRSQKFVEGYADVDTVHLHTGDALYESDLDTVTLEQEPITEELPAFPGDPQRQRLAEILQDKHAHPANKAKLIHQQCSALMQNILGQPGIENIFHAKALIGDIVDHLVIDVKTAHYLTQVLTSDPSILTHSINVGILGVLLTRITFPDLKAEELRELAAAYFFHDLGRVSIPEYIFRKAGSLNTAEWAMVHTHPAEGEKILKRAHQLTDEMACIVMQHHERTDGSGYPLGLRGSNINQHARICGIIDTFDALTSKRAYKRERSEMSVYEAMNVIKREMIGPLDRSIFNNFVMLFN